MQPCRGHIYGLNHPYIENDILKCVPEKICHKLPCFSFASSTFCMSVLSRVESTEDLKFNLNHWV